jgi:glutamine amidotransferase/cyclase
VYVSSPEEAKSHTCIKSEVSGPDGQEYCWYECTVKGGREARDLDVVQLATSVQALGAGEILLNCMDRDGSNAGYDLELLKMVRGKCTDSCYC